MTETAAPPELPVETTELSDGGELPALELRGIGKRYSLGRRAFSGLRRRLHRRGTETAAEGRLDEDEDVDDDDVDDDDDIADDPPDTDSRAPRNEGAHAIWALRDVTFDVPRGKSIAIIGSGGSGKTTLLKILSRVTPPTEGSVVVRGRVAPLLGRIAPLMQGEFTGRQNVFLISELYGVPRDAAAERLDEIFTFAGITAFADTKVKKYSSGMQQQLAFSIVLNLDPDVMLADGALTVGDPIFRARSLERLEERQRDGLAILIASNDTASLRRLCDEAIWLENGRVVARGDVVELTQRYDEGRAGVKQARRHAATALRGDDAPRTPSGLRPKAANVIDVGLFSMDGSPLPAVVEGRETLVEATVVSPQAEVAMACSVTLVAEDRAVLRIVQDEPFVTPERGWYAVSGYFPAGTLPAGASIGDASAIVVRPDEPGIDPPVTDAVDVPENRHVEWSWQRIRKRRADAGVGVRSVAILGVAAVGAVAFRQITERGAPDRLERRELAPNGFRAIVELHDEVVALLGCHFFDQCEEVAPQQAGVLPQNLAAGVVRQPACGTVEPTNEDAEVHCDLNGVIQLRFPHFHRCRCRFRAWP